MINPLEPILIGYLNKSNIDYNLIKEAVTNLYTNQFSQNLIDKLLKNDLKEVAWLLVNDNKSSYQNIKTKVSLLNDLLKFDTILDTLFNNKNLKNDVNNIYSIIYSNLISFKFINFKFKLSSLDGLRRNNLAHELRQFNGKDQKHSS